jgi:hypothetical protein
MPEALNLNLKILKLVKIFITLDYFHKACKAICQIKIQKVENDDKYICTQLL